MHPSRTRIRSSDRGLLMKALLVAALGLGLALVSAVCPVHAQTDGELCGNKDVDVSIAACTAVIQKKGTSKILLAAAYVARGGAYLNKELYDQAIADFTTSISLQP